MNFKKKYFINNFKIYKIIVGFNFDKKRNQRRKLKKKN